MLNTVIEDASQVTSLEEIRNGVLGFNVHMLDQHIINPFSGQAEKASHRTTYRVVTENDQPKMVKLGEVGAKYHIYQNNDFLDNLVPIEESGLVKISTAGTIDHGSKVFVDFELTEIEPVPGDTYYGFLMAFNSHDGSTCTGFSYHVFRVWCRNSFFKALSAKANLILSARHGRNVKPNMEKIREAVNLTKTGFIAVEEDLKALSKIVIQDEETILKVVKTVYNQKKLEAEATKERKPRVLDDILNLFENGKGQNIPGVRGTGLALFNAITEHTNHVSGADRIKKPSTADSRLNSVMFGQGKTINQKAMDTILALR